MVFSFLDQDLQDFQDFQDLCQAEFEYVILNAVKNLRFSVKQNLNMSF